MRVIAAVTVLGGGSAKITDVHNHGIVGWLHRTNVTALCDRLFRP